MYKTCSSCRKRKSLAKFRRTNNICRTCEKYKKRQIQYEAKLKVIKHYGGKCVCCGSKELSFLTLDHIDNDGHIHRKDFNRSLKLYQDLIKNDFKTPFRIQILCANCHQSKSKFGRCIHGMTKKEIEIWLYGEHNVKVVKSKKRVENN